MSSHIASDKSSPAQIRQARVFRGVYVAPLAHLTLALIAYSGYVIPPLQFLGILGSVLTIVDFPLSIVAAILSFRSDALAVAWVLIVGTCWWYLISLAVEQHLKKKRAKAR